MRDINWDKPLSKADREWAMQRDELIPKVQANEEQFKAGTDKSKDDSSTDLTPSDEDLEEKPSTGTVEDDYDQWKVAELRDEAAKRQPPVDVTDLKKDEIITAMRAWDAAHPEG
jgi:hypothetical protein